uniref:RanBP2-type domain-containing protein n=1 Tax=Timema monikensis TaxID=170555 RepID=A0A7R9DZA3_9NEOP|nr:unnamed protein product [Timema monikensis]
MHGIFIVFLSSPHSYAGLANVQKRDRQESSDSDEDYASKRSRYPVYIKLECESYHSEASESIHSVQEKETDFAHDTSDLSSHTELSDDGAVGQNQVEYEVVTASEDGIPEISSESDDALELCVAATAAIVQNNSDLADTSGDDSPSGDPELSLADYWTCCMCKTKKNNPMYRYCEKCFRLRKNFCPPRPSRLKKRTARNKRLKQKLTKSSSFCSTVILTSDKSDLEKDLCSASSVSFSSLDKQTDASSLGSSHKPLVCMMDADSTEDLPKHRVVTLCDPTGCSTDKMNGVADRVDWGVDRVGWGVDRVGWGVDCVDGGVDCVDGGVDRVDGGADRLDDGADRVDSGVGCVDSETDRVDGVAGRVDSVDYVDGGVDCIDRSVSYIEGRTDTAVTSVIDATDSGKGSSQEMTENSLQCSFLASQELSQKSSLLQYSFSESQELSQKSSLLQYSFSESQELSQKSSRLQYSFSESQELPLKRSIGTMTSSQDPMCITCLIRPINASFIHGKNTHTVCCYNSFSLLHTLLIFQQSIFSPACPQFKPRLPITALGIRGSY